MSVQDKLANLRKLKEEREKLAQEIKVMQDNISLKTGIKTGINAGEPRVTSWDRHKLSMAAEPQLVADWVQSDFQTFNQDKIENKLKTARAKVLVSGIMSEADIAYQHRIAELGVDNLASLHEANNIISTRRPHQTHHQTTTKRIIITANNNISLPSQLKTKPGKTGEYVDDTDYTDEYGDEDKDDGECSNQSPSSQNTVLSSRAVSILGDDEKQQVICEFIDAMYAKIIKIVKVYFIRAIYFDYQIPSQPEIIKIKERLLGHMHVPNLKWATKLSSKTRVEYLNITWDGRIELASAWVMRIRGYYLFVSHDMIGQGKGVKNKWRKLTPDFPIFHKITNDDINIECGFLDTDTSTDGTESQITDYSEMIDIIDNESNTDTDHGEFNRANEEYDSND